MKTTFTYIAFILAFVGCGTPYMKAFDQCVKADLVASADPMKASRIGDQVKGILDTATSAGGAAVALTAIIDGAEDVWQVADCAIQTWRAQHPLTPTSTPQEKNAHAAIHFVVKPAAMQVAPKPDAAPAPAPGPNSYRHWDAPHRREKRVRLVIGKLRIVTP